MYEHNNLMGQILIGFGLALILVFFVLRKKLPKWVTLIGMSLGFVLVALMVYAFFHERELIQKNREILEVLSSAPSQAEMIKDLSAQSKEWKACAIDTDCKIVEGACSDVVAINKNHTYPAQEKERIEKFESCWSRDYKNADIYRAVCSKGTCVEKLDPNNPKGIYRAWHRNAAECLSVPSGYDRNLESGYCADFKLNPYLGVMGEFQKVHPNLEAVRDLFKVVIHNSNSANEMFSFALGDTYLTNTKYFEIAFNESSKEHHSYLCGSTNWGLLNANVVSTDKRLSVFEKLCGPLRQDP